MKDKLTQLILLTLALVLLYFSNGVNILPLFKHELAVANRSLVIKTLPQSEFHGWVAWWDEETSLQSLETNGQKLKTVSPMWYKIGSTGTLETIPHTKEVQIKNLRESKQLKIVPLVTNDFDSRRTGVLLNSPELRDKFIKDLISLALDSGYSGFDIDFEEISPTDQPAFLEFIKLLSDNLHKKELILMLSTHASTGESDREVVKGYDLEKLAEHSDFIKVMAYDFHNQNSFPGAVTPIDKLEKVLDHTSLIVPGKKIILGLPTYGYDWELESTQSAKAVSFVGANQIIAENQGSVLRDKDSQSLIGSYTQDEKAHQIWFGDAETVQVYIDKARSYGVYQFSYWRIGSEDPAIWK